MVPPKFEDRPWSHGPLIVYVHTGINWHRLLPKVCYQSRLYKSIENLEMNLADESLQMNKPKVDNTAIT